jgi:hypothetical protein
MGHSQKSRDRARALEMQRRMNDPTISGSGGIGGFGVSVTNNVVKKAKVVIGWVNGISYHNSDGVQISISSETADIEIAETSESGIAFFTRTSAQWILEDYTRVLKGISESPDRLYAPIHSYGGVQDTDYDPIPMYSNFSMRNVNPITTLLTSSIPNRSLQEVDPVELIKTIAYLEEWTGKTYSDSDKEKMVTGRVTQDLYEDILTPVRNSKNLFDSLEIDNKSKIEIEIAGRQTVTTSKSSYTAAELTGLYNFSEYVEARKSGEGKSDRIKWNNGKEDATRAGKLLGYEIETKDVILEINELLNVKGVDKGKFDDVVSAYSESLTKIDGDKVSKNIVSFSSIDSKNGDAIIKSSDSIEVNEEGIGLAKIYVKSPDKKETVYQNIPVRNAPSGPGIFAYGLNLYDGTIGEKELEIGTQFKVEVYTTNNRYQVTEYVSLSKTELGLIFTSVENGSLVPSIPGKGVVDNELPGKAISNIILTTIKKGEKIGQIKLPRSILQISGYTSWSGSSEGPGETFFVYWNGERYVVDNDVDPKKVLGLGSSNPDTPVGNYKDPNSPKGEINFIVANEVYEDFREVAQARKKAQQNG